MTPVSVSKAEQLMAEVSWEECHFLHMDTWEKKLRAESESKMLRLFVKWKKTNGQNNKLTGQN
jgi:hypothetical protein